MKKAITILFVCLFSNFVKAQEINDWQLALQLQPELTIHRLGYTVMQSESAMSATFNTGIVSTVQRSFYKKYFIEFGIGFISRKLNTSVDLNKARMFPNPYGLYTLEGNVSNSVSYRVLQLPLNLGFNLYTTERATFFAKGAIIPKFLLNTKYVSHNINEAFSNNYWQGYSLNAGLGFDYRLNDKFGLTNTLSYSVENNVKRDYYVSSQNADITLNHTFIQLNTGIKMIL